MLRKIRGLIYYIKVRYALFEYLAFRIGFVLLVDSVTSFLNDSTLPNILPIGLSLWVVVGLFQTSFREQLAVKCNQNGTNYLKPWVIFIRKVFISFPKE